MIRTGSSSKYILVPKYIDKRNGEDYIIYIGTELKIMEGENMLTNQLIALAAMAVILAYLLSDNPLPTVKYKKD